MTTQHLTKDNTETKSFCDEELKVYRTQFNDNGLIAEMIFERTYLSTDTVFVCKEVKLYFPRNQK